MFIIEWVREIFSDMGLALSFLSLLATIVVSFMIYWLQRHHEREIEKMEERQRKQDLSNKANAFLVDHEADRDYLPWCAIASNLHRHEHHARDIYKQFCRLSDEIQSEVLTMAGYEFEPLPKNEWVQNCMELLIEDIQKYNLGQNVLYDGGKYFTRGFERYRESVWINTERDNIFDPIYKGPWFKMRPGINCNSYVDEFLHFRKMQKKSEDIALFNMKPIPPIDYVWGKYDLGNCDENVVCAWVMTLVRDISLKIPVEEELATNKHGKKHKNKIPDIEKFLLDYTDAEIEYYEDAYYAALQALYNTYYSQQK